MGYKNGQIIRHRTIMRFKKNHALRKQGAVVFEQDIGPKEPGRTMFDIALSFEKWNELGKPRVITVSIESGDMLNV